MPEKMPITPPDKDATSKRTADETTEAKAQGASHEAGKVPASTTAAWRPIINEPVVVRRVSRRNSFKRITSNGTIAAAAMVFGAILAVVVANSPAYFVVRELIEAPLGIQIGSFFSEISFEGFVNDFLMALFFLLVGVELKYEMTVGQLRDPRQAALPMLAAVGGVMVPAIIYSAVNWGGAVHGWAVPIATDIAFALGMMSLLGDRVAPATKVFFSTLAIADDILAIIVIAVFYGNTPDIAWVAASAGAALVLFCLNWGHVYRARHYMVWGLVLWVCMYNSGIHATLAGVIVAFALPARTDIKVSSLSSWLQRQAKVLDETYDEDSLVLGQHEVTSKAFEMESVMHHVTPPLQRVERSMSVFVNFIVLPLFAFVNAQVRLVGVDMGAVLSNPVAIGAYAGAVLGKPIGIIGVTWLLIRIGFSKLPRGVSWDQIVVVGIMGGIGFTMSILISGLAFTSAEDILAAKCAILAGSVTSSLLGMAFMAIAHEAKARRKAKGNAKAKGAAASGEPGVVAAAEGDGGEADAKGGKAAKTHRRVVKRKQ
ncbi:MAG: Na+/H+ antiporter NhaA [Atopobiaceae bacterium]|jgi:NhaA family Na+:H+ antiporter|nr:Na+/H+ antiporter NhaA [Atopobiaceae bacterium]MCI1431748.1 Na+/H+ antiporter NhaA [Atopobiaceae bacterium]MCI1470184.1 Na+/H+ antiporter NhaA [Atopobiaceae bacterium]